MNVLCSLSLERFAIVLNDINADTDLCARVTETDFITLHICMCSFVIPRFFMEALY